MPGTLTPKRLAQNALFRLGYAVRRLDSEERSAFVQFQRPDAAAVEEVFGGDIARLADLRRRYAAVNSPASAHSVWGSRNAEDNLVDAGLAGINLTRFRASGSYVWNYYGSMESEVTRLKYFVFRESVKSADTANLLDRLGEDGAFGCPTVEFPGTGLVSRDLLDSVAEINFLQRHLGVLDNPGLRVLDIGAGYGRLAHRLLEANPGLTDYTCVDAVPESTFLCEFYLKYRGVAERANVIPFDEVDENLNGQFDVALNIHSFSECTYEAVEWWLNRVRTLEIPHLMIVPNPGEGFDTDPERFTTSEADGSKRNYLALLTELGYEVVAREPVVDELTRSVLKVEDVMFLFRLRPTA